MVTTVLLISLAVQVLATVTAAVLTWRTRRLAWMLITLAFGVMAARRSLALLQIVNFEHINDLPLEITGLAVSFLFAIGLLALCWRQAIAGRPDVGMVHASVSNHQGQRLGARLAISIGVLAIVSGAAVGYAAYAVSRDAMLRTLLDSYLNQVSLLAESADQVASIHSTKGDGALILDAMRRSWESTPQRFPGSYLCAVDSHGTLILHTAHPDKVGCDIGSLALEQAGSRFRDSPRTVRELAASQDDWCGRITSLDGEDQFVAFSYVASIDALLALHSPAKAFNHEILTTAVPWGVGLGIVLGGLIPLALGLLFRAYSASQSHLASAIKAVQESETRFHFMADHAPVMIWLTDLNAHCTYVNLGWQSFTGRSMEQELGPGWLESLHPDDRRQSMDTYLSAFNARQAFRMEFRVRRFDGEYRWVLSAGMPRVLPDHSFAGYIGTCVDITEHRELADELRISAELQKLMLSELDHRVRNNLTSLMALIDISARGATDVGRFAAAIRSRVNAMAKVHSMLALRHWRSLSLVDILRTLTPPEHIGQVELEGPTVLVPPHQATGVGMVIQELFANSLKYGSLSVVGGRVQIQWRMLYQQAPEPEQLELMWVETDGPPITDPPRPKVGTTLIEGFVRAELRGSMTMSYPPAGASHRFQFSLADDDVPQPAPISVA